MSGNADDADAHVAEARRRGAIGIVSDRDVEPGSAVWVLVADARCALADLAAEFFNHPSRRLKLFAVTGTDGKTTTTYLLEQIFASAGYQTGLVGTVETKVGNHREINLGRMTTPESLDLQRLLSSMVDAGVSHVAMEASSHALALGRLRKCSFAGVAITNLTGDHIEFHGSWQKYLEVKASLFTELGVGRPGVFNADDPHTHALSLGHTGPTLLYGLDSDADLRAIDLSPSEAGTQCSFTMGSSVCDVRIPVPGNFNVLNALGAAGLALTDGIRLERITQALSAARMPPGRMQSIDTGQPFRVIVDYAHTVNAFTSVLSGVRSHMSGGGRLIAVFGAAGNRDRSKRPQLAKIAHGLTDYFFITNEDPFGENAGSIIEQIVAGVPAADKGRRFEVEPDRAQAILRAVERARPGDTVVILGKGHEESIVVNGRKVPWSDARFATEALGAQK
ncbi:MAG: UDP-N-acetylmuramoyl-L-alanyl-D-glutamate--2,6-diaminopimelate ligase [Chloroflexota bacterium]